MLLDFLEVVVFYIYTIYINNQGQDQANTRSSQETCSGQETLSFLTPTVSNNLRSSLKLSNNLKSFKHRVKEQFFQKPAKKKNKIFSLTDAASAIPNH